MIYSCIFSCLNCYFTLCNFVSSFPKRNRDGRAQTHDEVRKQLSKSGTNGWTFTDLLSDFQLLLYLTEFLDMDSIILGVASSIVEKRDVDDGYKIMVSSLVGLKKQRRKTKAKRRMTTSTRGREVFEIASIIWVVAGEIDMIHAARLWRTKSQR